jgi:predicted ATPase/DNA-binding CsgD family transcriptional regulator
MTIPVGNLPAPPNEFIGRERDLSELGSLLPDSRVVTLCGPGGIGKTRLALELAARLAFDFADGAWLVELADLSDPALVTRRLAASLGIREEPGILLGATVADALRPRRVLIVLDNCEHLIDECASLVRHLLARCAWVKVIATSREQLRIRGEIVWRVPPLELPPAQGQMLGSDITRYDAVRLFTARATSVSPAFSLNQDNAQTIAMLCRTLDGIPLAIELAAARVRALSVEQISDRLNGRFQLLTSGDRVDPPRQRTLRAAMEWSYGLLTEPEQVLLRRLSVFSGWTLEMAEQVCADEQVPAENVLDLLAALIDKSLVTTDSKQASDTRYRLLDTIREYASIQLEASGEQDAFRAAHRACLVQLAEEFAAQAFTRGEPPWPVRAALYRRMAAELANFRAALSECLSRADAEQGLQLCMALCSPWVAAGELAEGANWLDRFLALSHHVSTPIRGMALVCRAQLAYEQHEYPTAAGFAEEGLKLLRGSSQQGESGALSVLAQVKLQADSHEEALTAADAAVASARAAGNRWEEGLALSARAAVVGRLGRRDEAEQNFDAALDALGLNNGWGIAQTMFGYGTLAWRTGDHATALACFRNALAVYREIDAQSEMARCLTGIGEVALAQLDLDLAAASLAESIRLSLASGERLAISQGIETFAALAVAADNPATAARLAGAAAALRDAAPHAVTPNPPHMRLVLDTARQRLGTATADTMIAEGRQLSASEAVSLALRLHHAANAEDEYSGLSTAPLEVGPTRAESARSHDPGETPEDGAQDRQNPFHNVPGLTAREQVIAGLITRGLSNKAIAAELGISPGTAARHVANIFGKLGFSSRSQIAAWAAERNATRNVNLE